MRRLAGKVSALLETVDFPALWKGFCRYPFALYDAGTVYLENGELPRDRRFLGNTAIEYENGFLAIWHVEKPENEDPVLLAASLVHEMFHAFQRQRGETRYPNDLIGLDYPRTAEVLLAKNAENALLKEAVSTGRPDKKRALLNDFIALRLHRAARMGGAMEQELLSETAEGMAELAGLKALKGLSGTHYEKSVQGHLDALDMAGKNALDMRKTSYASGSLFLLAAEEAGLRVWHEVGKETASVFGLLCGGVSPKEPPAPAWEERAKAEALLTSYEGALKRRFQEFAQKAPVRHEASLSIRGYDPMNMVKRNGKVLCSHFIMLGEKGGEPRFIQGPVLLHMEEGSFNKITAYETVGDTAHV